MHKLHTEIDTPATGAAKPVLPYRPARDEVRMLSAVDVVIASFFVGVALLTLFLAVLFLVSAFQPSRRGSEIVASVVAIFACCLIGVAAVIAARRRLSGRRPESPTTPTAQARDELLR
jgi:VIT1/CCC1 family predicted Fe2+/Mn2+ transporter